MFKLLKLCYSLLETRITFQCTILYLWVLHLLTLVMFTLSTILYYPILFVKGMFYKGNFLREYMESQHRELVKSSRAIDLVVLRHHLKMNKLEYSILESGIVSVYLVLLPLTILRMLGITGRVFDFIFRLRRIAKTLRDTVSLFFYH